MKTNLTKIFTTFVVAAILAVGVSYVSAYSPSTPVPGIFTTKNDDQTKQGGIMSEKFMASDLGFFTKLLAPGSISWVNIGGPFSGNDPQGISNSGGTSPLTIHLNGAKRPTETKSGVSGITGTKFIADAGTCAAPITWVNDRASSFDFISTSNPGGYADLIAGQVRLNGGTPQDGSVLAAIDDQGNAVWAKLEIRNGAVVVVENQTGSPVSTDAACTVPPNTTYAWSTGEWGACQITGAAKCDPAESSTCSCSTIEGFGEICIDIYGPDQIESNDNALDSEYGSNEWRPIAKNMALSVKANAPVGNRTPLKNTYTIDQVGIKSRLVLCKDSNGNTVASSLCKDPVPSMTDSCTISNKTVNLEYRVRTFDMRQVYDSILGGVTRLSTPNIAAGISYSDTNKKKNEQIVNLNNKTSLYLDGVMPARTQNIGGVTISLPEQYYGTSSSSCKIISLDDTSTSITGYKIANKLANDPVLTGYAGYYPQLQDNAGCRETLYAGKTTVGGGWGGGAVAIVEAEDSVYRYYVWEYRIVP